MNEEPDDQDREEQMAQELAEAHTILALLKERRKNASSEEHPWLDEKIATLEKHLAPLDAALAKVDESRENLYQGIADCADSVAEVAPELFPLMDKLAREHPFNPLAEEWRLVMRDHFLQMLPKGTLPPDVEKGV
jgi:hypothetical protein